MRWALRTLGGQAEQTDHPLLLADLAAPRRAALPRNGWTDGMIAVYPPDQEEAKG